MSIETMVTLGLAAAIFVTGLLLLGMLTLITRLAMFVLRPAARGGFSMARRYAPVARGRLATFWDRTRPAVEAVGDVLGAEALALTQRAAAVSASWSRRLLAQGAVVARRLSAHASAWGRGSAVRAASVRRRSAAGAVSLGKRSAAGARHLGRRSAAGATRLSERSADGMTTYVVPAVRSLFTDDEDLGLDPNFSARRHRTRHS